MAFEDVPAGQELHCRCETLINYEEMKGASLCSFESVELILVLTHRLANSGGFCQFSNRVAVGRFQSLTLEPAIINSFSSPRKLPTLLRSPAAAGIPRVHVRHYIAGAGLCIPHRSCGESGQISQWLESS